MRTGNQQCVALLIQFFAEVNACDCDGKSPLHLACVQGNLELVKTLVSNRAFVNLMDEEGNTPLHVACHYLHPTIVLFLLEKSADVKIQNQEGKTAKDLMVVRAKQAGKKDCDACINKLTQYE